MCFILLQFSPLVFYVCIIRAGGPEKFPKLLNSLPRFKFTIKRCEHSPFPLLVFAEERCELSPLSSINFPRFNFWRATKIKVQNTDYFWLGVPFGCCLEFDEKGTKGKRNKKSERGVPSGVFNSWARWVRVVPRGHPAKQMNCAAPKSMNKETKKLATERKIAKEMK